jgi:predicted deacylase
MDRRNLVAAAFGLSAAGLIGANVAAAQADPVSGMTVHTGDVVQGKPVVSALNLRDLESGKKHALLFQGVQMPTGEHWYVSVIAVRGGRPGKRVALVGGVHGDEISPIRTIQAVVEQLDPAAMTGDVLAVLDVSRPAQAAMARRWPSSGRGIDLVDINREWPGDANAPTASARHAALLFDRLLRPNADYAIDFHTATTGMDMTALHLARMDLPEVRAMAELFPIDHIFDNAGYPGLLANALIDAGIPAFTPEIGAPRVLDRAMIPRFVEGTMNVLRLHAIVDGAIGRTGKDSGVVVGDRAAPIVAMRGGYVELLVELKEKVAAGQTVAVQRDAFGEVVADYVSPVDGEIAARRTDATAEPGNLLLMVLHAGATATPEGTYVE